MPTIKTVTKQVPIDLARSTEDSEGNILAATALGVGVEYRLYGVVYQNKKGEWRTDYVVVPWPMSGPRSAFDAMMREMECVTFQPETNDPFEQWAAWDAGASYIIRLASMDLLGEWGV